MYLGKYYFKFPLYLVCGDFYPVVGDYLAVFTEPLHAERFSRGEQIYQVNGLDDLYHVIDSFQHDNYGVCFDPVDNGDKWVSKVAYPFDMVRLAIDLERMDPD
jgi:hypothetical protein